MTLARKWCDFKPERDAEVLRSLKTLEKSKCKPADEVLKEVNARKPGAQFGQGFVPRR
jgi:hypothetical protein